MRSPGFECDNRGSPHPASQHNIRLALAKLGVEVRYDAFSDRVLVDGNGMGPLLNDHTIDHLWLLVDRQFKFRPGKELFTAVVGDAARDKSFHPVKDYLASLRWDGKIRIDKWLVTYGGADETDFVCEVGELLLIAAVRRIRQPGCKFDEMVVFESEQGKDRSSALAALAVKEDWFSDDLPLNADSKKVIEALRGRWIVEACELHGMRRGDVEALKAFLSRRTDRARMSYDRIVSEMPRQSVFVGTTNNSEYLRDQTGNRRFWPVQIPRFDLKRLKDDRDQLWAEAAHIEAQDASIRLDPSLYRAAEREQELRVVEDPFVAVIAQAIGDKPGKISSAKVWDILAIPVAQRTQDHCARLGEAMRRLGFKRTKLRFGRGPEHAYWRGDKGNVL